MVTVPLVLGRPIQKSRPQFRWPRTSGPRRLLGWEIAIMKLVRLLWSRRTLLLLPFLLIDLGFGFIDVHTIDLDLLHYRHLSAVVWAFTTAWAVIIVWMVETYAMQAAPSAE